jgi:ribonuclease-3
MGDFCILKSDFLLILEPPAGSFLEKLLERQDLEKRLEKKVGYVFKDRDLLCEALTHRSFTNERVGIGFSHNERLEFLGDAVLDLVISQIIFSDYKTFSEGDLTRVRAEVVNEKTLADLGRQCDLGDCLLLGRGEQRSGGRDKDSLLADALEALLGAVFCDSGFEGVRPVIETLFREEIECAALRKVGVDHKTRLQEVLQARHGFPPTYRVVDVEGPDHQRNYTIEVQSEGEVIGSGRGRTKKGAEQEAARRALESLED